MSFKLLGRVAVFLTTSTEDEENLSARCSLKLGTENFCLASFAAAEEAGEFCCVAGFEFTVFKLRLINDCLCSDEKGDSRSVSWIVRSSLLFEVRNVELTGGREEMWCSVCRFLINSGVREGSYFRESLQNTVRIVEIILGSWLKTYTTTGIACVTSIPCLQFG